MTEKRYYSRDYEELYYIFDSNTISEKEFDEKEEYEGYTAFEDSLGSEEIVNLLNENEQLKQTVSDWSGSYDELFEDIKRLEEENEQLKQFQDRVFSWIDMHLQRLPTLRDDEFESDNEFADPSLYSGAIQILETMKKELKGDMK